MILVKVQHFLNEEGKEYFPTFIKEMRKAMIEYNKGFISLRQLFEETNPEETHLLLEYENFDLLKEFSKTPKHDVIEDELKKYQIQKQEIEKYFT